MRKAATILRIVALALFIVALAAMLLTVLGIRYVPAGYNYVSIFDVEGNEWLLPTWGVALGLVAVALLLCRLLCKKENSNWIPLLIAAGGAILALVVALEIKGALPSKVGVQYPTEGITAWRLIWRHLTPVFAGALVAVAAWFNRVCTRDERILAENEAYKEHYDLSGDPLFAEGGDSTIGLEEYAEDFGVKKPARRLKRSLRQRKKK